MAVLTVVPQKPSIFLGANPPCLKAPRQSPLSLRGLQRRPRQSQSRFTRPSFLFTPRVPHVPIYRGYLGVLRPGSLSFLRRQESIKNNLPPSDSLLVSPHNLLRGLFYRQFIDGVIFCSLVMFNYIFNSRFEFFVVEAIPFIESLGPYFLSTGKSCLM